VRPTSCYATSTPARSRFTTSPANHLIGAASLGQVGLDWQLGGFAADPPTLPGAFTDVSNDQLVQAMAGFDGSSGTADGLNAVDDAAQQQLLTMPLQG
jgi:hypothetical protein